MHKTFISKIVLFIFVVFFAACTINAYEQHLVKDGKAASEIVVAEKPFRMVAKAALELQKYIKTISGAELNIVNKPTSEELLKIYIGKSQYTDELGITDDGLKYGAFKMVSGEGYLVLLGYDFDFEPKEPWAHQLRDRGRAQKKWEEISGSYTINTMNRNLFRAYHEGAGIWSHDGAGSFNAVCEYLRSLGVRWYMPGELGEVVPEMQTIPLKDIKKTVIADHPLRRWFGLYGAYSEDTLFWEQHLGMNSGYQLLGAGMHVHGMWLILSHEKMFEANPEYYALEGGKRNPKHACFSNEGLAKEAAHFARLVYDYYNEPCISLWPNDGLRKCQCAECAKFTTGELVCRFVDKVARDLYTTHPDKWVSFGAYSSYRYPPENLGKFPPNVLIFLSAHRPQLRSEERWEKRIKVVNGWLKSVEPKRLIRNSNNYYDLVMHPRSFARELKALKDISLGEWSEQRIRTIILPDKSRHVAWLTPGIDHLNQYVNARFLWDADQDVEKLLAEYYNLFYGPAAEEVRKAFDYAEENYTIPEKGRPQFIKLEKRITFAELLTEGKKKAGESIYSKRIDSVLECLQPLEQMKRNFALAEKRDDSSKFFRIISLANDHWKDMRDTLVMDGKLDEPFWKAYPYGGKMVYSDTGKRADLETSFFCRWYKKDLIFGIRCEEKPGAKLNITTEKDNDKAILGGDRIEILLETNVNSYYRIVVNPAGALWDTNMAEGAKIAGEWDSQAEVSAFKGDGFWSIEIKIPVLDEDEGMVDPLHNVVGRYPTMTNRTWAWFFNIGRVKVEDSGTKVYSYKKTGSASLQNKIVFAKFGSRK